MNLKSLSIVTVLLFACTAASTVETTERKVFTEEELSASATAYFASGCFWCVEAIFESVKGVREAESGYAGGHTENPTYQSTGTGTTGHTETVKVYYDPEIISFDQLLIVFFDSHDPTTVNGQSPDFGSQYRSIAFYETAEEKAKIEAYMKELTASKVYDKPLATEVAPLKKFFIAEDYHQNYEHLNPNNSYVRNVSVPRLKRFQAKHPELLK